MLRTDYSFYENCTVMYGGHPGTLHTSAEIICGTVLKQALSSWRQPEAKICLLMRKWKYIPYMNNISQMHNACIQIKTLEMSVVSAGLLTLQFILFSGLYF
jgi:hypothetical protein